jgi:hypothetical protein
MIKKYFSGFTNHTVLFVAIIAVLANMLIYVNIEIYNRSGTAEYNNEIADGTRMMTYDNFCQSLKAPLGGLAFFGIIFPIGYFLIQLLAILISAMQISAFYLDYRKRKKISASFVIWTISILFLSFAFYYEFIIVALPAIFLIAFILYKHKAFIYSKGELAIAIALMYLSEIMIFGAWMGVEPWFYSCSESANPFL